MSNHRSDWIALNEQGVVHAVFGNCFAREAQALAEMVFPEFKKVHLIAKHKAAEKEFKASKRVLRLTPTICARLGIRLSVDYIAERRRRRKERRLQEKELRACATPASPSSTV
jgi:hypothetical protein